MDPHILAELQSIVGIEGLSTDLSSRRATASDATFLSRLPEAVALPRSTEEVARVLALAHREAIPLTVRGAGSGLAGGAVPLNQGVVLSLERMNAIREIDTVNSVAVVEAGAITGDVHRAVEAHGLFYPPDPSSVDICSIGGNVATNAGGLRCLKYGVTRDYILGLTVVLADGRVLELGGKTVKNATGYQLMQLMVGTEGTLGVVTQAVLRLRPLPRVHQALQAAFPTLDAASRTVTAIMSAGVLPAVLELMDRTCMDVVKERRGIPFPPDAQVLLLLEQDGNDAQTVAHEVEEMARICEDFGALRVALAQNEQERQEIWAARRAVSPALGESAPSKLGEDIVVPRAHIPEMVRRIQRISQESGLTIAVFGHAGDGNLHPNILFDRTDPRQVERVEKAAAAIFRAALDLGGALSGEHGIGLLKREFLEEALGTETVAVMRAVKQALDPRGILNPGIMFPTQTLHDGGSRFLSTLLLGDATSGRA